MVTQGKRSSARNTENVKKNLGKIAKREGRIAKSDELATRNSQIAINEQMTILDLIALCPEAEPILKAWGLHCVGCMGSTVETIGEGARGHGFGDDDIAALLQDIRDAAKNTEVRPSRLTVTTSAAKGIQDIAKKEEKSDHVLLVTVDGSGGFCMEFLPQEPVDALNFSNADVPELKIFSTALTLHRIGGATIDFRDGRFKLDMPEEKSSGCACKGGGTCGC